MQARTEIPEPVVASNWRVFRENWGWLLALGIVSIILGVIALLDSIVATIASMLVFGWLLLIAGIVEVVHIFRDRKGGHILLHCLNAALAFVVGLMLLRYPVPGALIVTLLLTAYLVAAVLSN